MALNKKSFALAVLFFILLENHADCNDATAQSNNGDSSSIPMIASGKRMHNIMRFGKRPSGGENVLHFEKRENSKVPPHSFLYFGKRENEQSTVPDLILKYLRDNSKNATLKKSSENFHNMMRFGKRSPDGSNLIDYGTQLDDDYDGYLPNDYDIDEDKRGGHSMMYFGKRGGHNMMYFGKRAPGHNMLSFGKRTAGHNILSFGKRTAGHNILSFGKRPAGHNILSFGKRTAGHNILSFGKRDDDKRAHSMIHFGKRDDYEDDISEEEKRGGGHAMFHFGKREDGDELYPDEMKRASHSMIHFGKRDFDDEPIPYFLNPAASEKNQQQSMYRYGKKTGKNNHAMIHFGKRSIDQDASNAAPTSNQSDNTQVSTVSRNKRDLEAVENPEPMYALFRYGNDEEEDNVPDEDIENAIKASQTTMYYPGGIINPLPYAVDPLMSISPEYSPLIKKDASKNMFMRFG